MYIIISLWLWHGELLEILQTVWVCGVCGVCGKVTRMETGCFSTYFQRSCSCLFSLFRHKQFSFSPQITQNQQFIIVARHFSNVLNLMKSEGCLALELCSVSSLLQSNLKKLLLQRDSFCPHVTSKSFTDLLTSSFCKKTFTRQFPGLMTVIKHMIS